MAESAGTAAFREMQCENPRCGRRFVAPARLVGMLVRCPHCDAETRVPGAIDKPVLKSAERFCRVQIVKGPAFLHHEYALDPKHSYTFGKSDTCEIQIPGPTVSRHHAALHRVNGAWIIEDLNSSNGTHVNRRRIVQQELHDGDQIRIGEYVIAFLTPRKAAVAEGPLAEALPVRTDAEPLKLEEPALTPAPLPAATVALPETIHFEQRKEVQETYARAAREARTRAIVWAAAVVVGTCGVFWAMGWLKPSTATRPQPAGRRTTPMQAAMPPEFIEVVRTKRFGEARLAVQRVVATGDGELAGRMTALLDNAISQENAELLTSARDAMRAGDWKTVEAVLGRASAGEFERFAQDWRYVRERAEEKRLEALLIDIGERGTYEKLFTLTEEQRQRLAASASLAQKQAELLGEARCGLLVELEPAVAGAALLIDGEVKGELGKPIWKLVRGKTAVEIRAAGHRVAPVTVDLEPGEIRRVTMKTAVNAPNALWTLHVVRLSGRPVAVWAAARCLAETPGAGVEFKRSDLLGLESAARRSVDVRPPRVATLTLKGGDKIVGQYWTAPKVVSLRQLPGGQTRTIPAEDVVATEDFPAARAARMLGEYFFRERRAADGPLATLAALGELSIQFGASAEAGRELEPYIRDCVEELGGVCAGCAGAGRQRCSECGGKGELKGQITCDACKGTREVNCFKCRGGGTAACVRCGGDGKLARDVRRNGWVVKEYVRCDSCAGSGRQPCADCPGAAGRIACRRCKGTGQISGTDTCSSCDGSRWVECRACEGERTRESMRSADRDEAEESAKGLMSGDGR